MLKQVDQTVQSLCLLIIAQVQQPGFADPEEAVYAVLNTVTTPWAKWPEEKRADLYARLVEAKDRWANKPSGQMYTAIKAIYDKATQHG